MRFDLTAMVGVPVAVWGVSLGCGLAVERLLRIRVHNALLIVLGLCVSFVVIFPGYALGAGVALALALLLGIACVGLFISRHELRDRLNPGWPGAAGVCVYVLFMLPVFAHGHWTWSGYDFVNDSAFEMLLAEHIKGYGTTLGNISATIPETSARDFLAAYLGASYPLGSQALLGTYAGLLDVPVAVAYQAFISSLAAVAAVALALVAGGALSARRAALAGGAAVAANLTFQYALQGGIKEIALLTMVCACCALVQAALARRQPYAGAALIAIGVAAALIVYNAVAAPFIGALALVGVAVLVAKNRVRPSRRWLAPAAFLLALAALLAIPSLTTFSSFFHVAEAQQSATGGGATQYGQLLRRLPFSQVSGVWLNGEYRLPVPSSVAATLTVVSAIAVLALAIPGALLAIARGGAGPLLALGTAALVLLIVLPRVSPYAQGKLLAITSPAIVLCALVCLLALPGRVSRVGLLLAGAVVTAVIASDLLAYSRDRVAPTGRMQAIAEVGDHFAGKGPLLWNEFEEYAKYFARAALISSPFEAITPQQVQLRHPTYFYGHYFDLDEERLSFVERYPIVVTRRSPAASRPPANYVLAYENRYYLAWRRLSHPHVLRHLPEGGLYTSSGTVSCTALASLIAGTPAGSELVSAVAPEVSWFEPLYAHDRSYSWGLDPGQSGAVETNGPGHASGIVHIGDAGLYGVWIQGDFPAPIQVRLDGREAGTASGSETPLQWHQVGSARLRAGNHTLAALRPGGHRHLGPGEFGSGTVGAVALAREAPERLVTVPIARWRSLCGAGADWVELVRR